MTQGHGAIESIGQIHISVKDIDTMVAFYRDVLGLTFLFDVPGQSMAFFDCGGVRLYLGQPESDAFRSNPLLYFRVADLEAACAALDERGLELDRAPHIVHKTEHGELWMASFTDPEGNPACLMSEVPA